MKIDNVYSMKYGPESVTVTLRTSMIISNSIDGIPRNCLFVHSSVSLLSLSNPIWISAYIIRRQEVTGDWLLFYSSHFQQFWWRGHLSHSYDANLCPDTVYQPVYMS